MAESTYLLHRECILCTRETDLSVWVMEEIPYFLIECPECGHVQPASSYDVNDKRPRRTSADMLASLKEGVALIKKSAPSREVVYPSGRYHGD